MVGDASSVLGEEATTYCELHNNRPISQFAASSAMLEYRMAEHIDQREAQD
jgi:hypothetical protein